MSLLTRIFTSRCQLKFNIRNFYTTSRVDQSTARIHIKYSNGPVYKAQFTGLSKDLHKTFPNQVSVTGEALKQQDAFEVAVDDEVIHSKRFGDGFTDKQCKKQIVLDSVRLSLKKKGNRR